MRISEQLKLGKPPVRGDLEGIQYLRGAAALMVVFDHASAMMAEPKYFGRHPFSGVFEAGAVGVDLFFCLSGFIIVYITLSKSLEPKLKPLEFFKRRFARIIPFMWVMIIAYAGLRISARGYFPYWDYLRGLTLFPVGHVEPSQVWTLRHEWLFYIIFASTFLSGRWWLFVAWAISPFAATFLLPKAASGTGFGLQFLEFLFNNINLLFGLGVIVGLVFVKSNNRFQLKRWAAPLLLVGLVAVFLTAGWLSYDRAYLGEVLIIGVLSCVCLIIACSVAPANGPLAWLGKTLGDASYCIYLSHPAFISALLGLFASHFQRVPDGLIMGATITISIVGGVILNKLVEDPVVSISKTILLKRPARKPATAPAIVE